MVLISAFSLAVISTDAGHCLDACDDCPESTFWGDDCHALSLGGGSRSSVLFFEATSAEERSAGSGPCLGASCLCHLHRIAPQQETYEASARLAFVFHKAPLFPELGVTDEILHVPKRSV